MLESPVECVGIRIADYGIGKAVELSNALMGILKEVEPKWRPDSLAIDVRGQLIEGFACLNWMLAVGVWSNLRDEKLRRDLMTESRSKMVLAAARQLCPARTVEDVAAEAVRIDFDVFRPFFENCLRAWSELERHGSVVDANSTLVVALEWILRRLGLGTETIGKAMPVFLIRIDDPVSIEEIASQVVRAAERSRRAVWWNPMTWRLHR